MAIKTNKQFCQEVLYELYGGMPPSDARISERFVLTKLHDQVAKLGVVSAFNTSNAEGITYADDIFYITFRNISVTLDAQIGLLKAELPQLPMGLPRQRSFNITPSSPTCDAQHTMIKMTERHEIQRRMSLPPVRKVFAYVTDTALYLYVNKAMFPMLKIPSINLTMATPAMGMDDKTNMPADMLAMAKAAILAELRTSLMIPQDIKNDGQEIKETQA